MGLRYYSVYELYLSTFSPKFSLPEDAVNRGGTPMDFICTMAQGDIAAVVLLAIFTCALTFIFCIRLANAVSPNHPAVLLLAVLCLSIPCATFAFLHFVNSC